MSRSIAEIYNRIIAEKEATPALDVLSSTSKVSVWRSWAYVTAVCIWLHEQIFDAHNDEVQGIIDNETPHHAPWYAAHVKTFQYGYTLVPGTHIYDNTGIDPALVEASKVVKYSAAVEIPKGILIKISGESGDDLMPLPSPQFEAFKEFMKRTKDLGVKLTFKNLPADTLRLHIKVYYDALLLDADGKRIDGTDDTPVPNAIRNYLKAGIDYDGGYYINARLIDDLQKVQGVKVPHIVLAESKYGARPFTTIEVQRQPDAGWMRIADADLTIEYIPYELL